MKEIFQEPQTQTGDMSDGRKIPLPNKSGINPAESLKESDLQNIRGQIERELLLNQIVQNIEQVVWLRDYISGRIVYVNLAFESVWGRSCASLYADPLVLIESVHPEDRIQVIVGRPQDNQKPLNQAYRILRPDGSLRWIYSRTFLIQNKTGDSTYLFCIAEDITDQKQVELALRRTLDRTREQFNLSRKMSLVRKSEAVLKTVMSAHELRASQRAALLLFDNPKAGPTRGMEVIATWLSSQTVSPWLTESSLYEEPGFWELLQPHQTVIISGIPKDPRLSPLVRDLLLEGQIQTIVIFPLLTVGEWRGCLLVYYNQDHFFDQIELRHLKVLVDQAAITLYNLQLLEVEEESRHEAERANEIKTEFLAMITHELRTPLTSILGFTNTLLAEDVIWEPDEQRDFVLTIQREADRLQELIDHLLVLSRLEAGMLPISQDLHLLNDIIEDAFPQLSTLTGSQLLNLHIPDNLPPVYVDARRISQVLVNLVRNSAAYAPQGSEIVISANTRGGFIQINVSDQGPGIPLVDHKRVFKAFRRGSNAEEGVSQGAGLGLAICKGLIEANGGRIWIKRKNTPGTTVSFTIPVAPSDFRVLSEEDRG